MSIGTTQSEELKKVRPRNVDPFYKKCYVCGTDNERGLHFVNRCEDGKGILEFQPRDFMVGLTTENRSLMHGGFTAMLFDEIMLFSVKNLLNVNAVSLNLNIDYMSPARMESTFVIETWVKEQTRRKIWMDGVMKDGDTIVAKGTGLYYQLDMEAFIDDK